MGNQLGGVFCYNLKATVAMKEVRMEGKGGRGRDSRGREKGREGRREGGIYIGQS